MSGPILVTGGTGRLGAPLVARLRADGADVRFTSRRADPAVPARFAVDLADGSGLAAALDGVDTVVHCASSPYRRTRSVDVDGTERLVRGCADAGVRHLLYVSIVGVDRVPLAYYRAKWDAERVVEHASIGWSILRATQFHPFVAEGLALLATLPMMPIPPARVQPVDVGVVVDHVVAACASGPAGRLPDLGGPRAYALRELAASWCAATHRRRLLLPLPALGAAARALRDGALCCAPTDGPAWEAWLADH